MATGLNASVVPVTQTRTEPSSQVKMVLSKTVSSLGVFFMSFKSTVDHICWMRHSVSHINVYLHFHFHKYSLYHFQTSGRKTRLFKSNKEKCVFTVFKMCTRASLFSVYPFDCTFSRILDCSETKQEVIVSLTPLNRASNPPSSAEQRYYSQHNTPDCRGCQEACSKPVITEQDKEQSARSIVKHISPTETEYVCLSRCGRCQIVWSLKCWYQRQGMKRSVKITIKKKKIPINVKKLAEKFPNQTFSQKSMRLIQNEYSEERFLIYTVEMVKNIHSANLKSAPAVST